MVPAPTPQTIVAHLHSEIVKALSLPHAKTPIATQGNVVIGHAPQEFAAFIRDELD